MRTLDAQGSWPSLTTSVLDWGTLLRHVPHLACLIQSMSLRRQKQGTAMLPPHLHDLLLEGEVQEEAAVARGGVVQHRGARMLLRQLGGHQRARHLQACKSSALNVSVPSLHLLQRPCFHLLEPCCTSVQWKYRARTVATFGGRTRSSLWLSTTSACAGMSHGHSMSSCHRNLRQKVCAQPGRHTTLLSLSQVSRAAFTCD